MKNTIVVGLQSGDEGKGKICDYLMKEHDVCVRYSGSCNTGATVVVNNKKYKFHHLPVGIIQNKKCFIGSSVLIDPNKLQEEINLYQNDFSVSDLLTISPNCHIITQTHINKDIENEKSCNKVGSTKRGVGPCSEDKYGRNGIRIETLDKFKQYFNDVSQELNYLSKINRNILFEGSQGALLDINHGTVYPHISTSENVAGAACSSCGFGPTNITNVVGVFKAYMTKVGTGPFPTEEKNDVISNAIVDVGHEYGTTTGRRRKIGWLDLPALRYAIQLNGCTELALVKYDVLEKINKIKVCIKYKIGDSITDRLPILKNNYCNCEPIYKEFDNISLNDFISFIELFVNCKIKYVSTGAEREEMIIF